MTTAATPPASPDCPRERARELAASATAADNRRAVRLVNARNPLPADFSPNLAPLGNGFYLDRAAAPYALLMIEAAKADGITLTVVSAFRDMERQRTNFRNHFNNGVNAGRTRAEAFAHTMSWIAVPGTSEHNAAVAIDFNSITESFDQTRAFRWLRDNAHEFGFVLRYPRDEVEITGVNYEPWHWRFVGVSHAARIRERSATLGRDITLEEYLDTCAEDDSVVDAFRASLNAA
jgi:D-alanyl-D-alanine carboxypeptidase